MRKARELDDAKRELDLKVEEKVQASLAKGAQHRESRRPPQEQGRREGNSDR
jgi:hypothetical protein